MEMTNSKTINLENLKKEYSACRKCEYLCKSRTNIVFGVGNPDSSSIMIIGEAPGKNEDLQNEPFVGKSGQVLNSLLEEIGLSRKNVYITNTILCRPPENRNPTIEELKNCQARLDEQIRILDPKVIITLGNFATKYMLQTKEGITNLHGKLFEKTNSTGKIIKIIPMFHPAVLLYSGNNPEKRKLLLDGFLVVKNILRSNSKTKIQTRLNNF